MYGRPAETVLAGWVSMTELCLERAWSARQLIGALSPA
jgi:hypothetical protein